MNTTNNKTIQVGTQDSTEYLAFGDDCQLGDILVYAFLIIKRDDIAQVESRVEEIKRFYGIASHQALHCRVLFSGDARNKAGIGHMSKATLHSIIARIVRIINQTPMYLRYAHCDLTEQKNHFEQLGAELELHNKELKPTMTIPITPDPKGLLGMLAQISLSTPPGDRCIPTIDSCQVIIAEDKSKVHFLGDQRRQAHNWSSGFSDIGAPPDTVFQLQPIIKKPNETTMLQLADIAAYICSQALSKSPRSVFFREQLRRVNLWTSSRFTPTPTNH